MYTTVIMYILSTSLQFALIRIRPTTKIDDNSLFLHMHIYFYIIFTYFHIFLHEFQKVLLSALIDFADSAELSNV